MLDGWRQTQGGRIRAGNFSALAIVFDCGPLWERTKLAAVLEQLQLFLHAFQLLAAGNQLLFFGAHHAVVECLWPPGAVDAAAAVTHDLRASIAAGVDHLISRSGDGVTSLISAAISKALCQLERVKRTQPNAECRVLVLQASPESAAQHLATMNCAFAAYDLGITLDVVVLLDDADAAPSIPSRDASSLALQQAAGTSGGLYRRPNMLTCAAISQYLITTCLPDHYDRQYFSPAKQGQLETRALCFLTKQALQLGCACSVCLAVFTDDKMPECRVCSTRFTGNLFLSRKKAKLTTG